MILIIAATALVNLTGVFGPELAFDALWYHLTIPKLYLHAQGVFHIPGGLLYYSAMPRLAEILFIPLIKLFGERGPHLLSFAAGLGTCILIYLIARKYLNRNYSLLAVSVFYITPIVGWISGSAYIDLIRTFWETMVILLILNKKYALTGVFLGLAISTKTLSMGSVPIDLIIIFLASKSISKTIETAVIAFLISVPWYLLSLLNTGYPLYPIGTRILDGRDSTWPQIMQPLSIIGDYWKVFMAPEDLISPIFVIIVPFMLLKLHKIWSKYQVLIVYFVLSYVVWWITPRLGGGRFILPYLPIWSVLTIIVVSLQGAWIKKLLIACIIVIAIVNLSYRFGVNYKLKDYLLGRESKQQYLCRNLNFNLGVFVDCDGFFSRNIKSSDLVLIKGVHNLYYIDFPYVHESWYRNERVDYTLIQGDQMAQKTDGTLVYRNNLTKIRLYKSL